MASQVAELLLHELTVLYSSPDALKIGIHIRTGDAVFIGEATRFGEARVHSVQRLPWPDLWCTNMGGTPCFTLNLLSLLTLERPAPTRREDHRRSDKL
jgi:hypothetical protein